MKFSIATAALLGLIFSVEGLQHITRNPARGHKQYRFALLEDGDYNSYIDTFLAELATELRESGDSVLLKEDFGHFLDSSTIVDYLFTNGVFLGLSKISRSSNVTYDYFEEEQLLTLSFDFAYTHAQERKKLVMGTEHLMLYVIGFVHIEHVDAVNDLFALIHSQFDLTDSTICYLFLLINGRVFLRIELIPEDDWIGSSESRLKVNFDFSVHVDNGPQYDGTVEDDVSTEAPQIGIVFDLVREDWAAFVTLIPVFNLDNTTVSWVDDTYANLSASVTQSSLEALLHGSSAIHRSFVDKLSTVLENVGLPVRPGM